MGYIIFHYFFYFSLFYFSFFLSSGLSKMEEERMDGGLGVKTNKGKLMNHKLGLIDISENLPPNVRNSVLSKYNNDIKLHERAKINVGENIEYEADDLNEEGEEGGEVEEDYEDGDGEEVEDEEEDDEDASRGNKPIEFKENQGNVKRNKNQRKNSKFVNDAPKSKPKKEKVLCV